MTFTAAALLVQQSVLRSMTRLPPLPHIKLIVCECGACAWASPAGSVIPLSSWLPPGKAEINADRKLEEKRAAEAKARFEARQARLEREKPPALHARYKSASGYKLSAAKISTLPPCFGAGKEKQAQASRTGGYSGG